MAKGIYRGVSNVARRVTNVYRGVSNVARVVKNGYRGVSNVARHCYPTEVVLYERGVNNIEYASSKVAFNSDHIYLDYQFPIFYAKKTVDTTGFSYFCVELYVKYDEYGYIHVDCYNGVDETSAPVNNPVAAKTVTSAMDTTHIIKCPIAIETVCYPHLYICTYSNSDGGYNGWITGELYKVWLE